MNLDTRARRAADGVRASTGGVDPMAQMAELKHEDKTRRRTSAVVVVGTTVAVVAVGIGWFVTQASGGQDSAPAAPMSSPSAVEPAPTGDLEPGKTVGTQLSPQLVAKAPDSWAIFKDAEYVNLGGTGGISVEIDGPLLQVDPKDNTGAPILPDEYARRLRENPSLTVLDERTVVVDGHRFPQLTVQVAQDASDVIGDGLGVRLGKYADSSESGAWREFVRGAVVTQTPIEVGGQTMVVTASGAVGDTEQAELASALDLVLSTMRLPN